jgi:hypothetical protein
MVHNFEGIQDASQFLHQVLASYNPLSEFLQNTLPKGLRFSAACSLITDIMGHCNKIETSFLLFALFHIAQSALRQILDLVWFVY